MACYRITWPLLVPTSFFFSASSLLLLLSLASHSAHQLTATLHTRSRSLIPAQLRSFSAIDQVTSWFSHDRPLSGHSGPSPDGSRLPEYRQLEHGSEFLEEAMPTRLTVLMRLEAICHGKSALSGYLSMCVVKDVFRISPLPRLVAITTACSTAVLYIAAGILNIH